VSSLNREIRKATHESESRAFQTGRVGSGIGAVFPSPGSPVIRDGRDICRQWEWCVRRFHLMANSTLELSDDSAD
jgi:hypothetical protein